MTTLQAEEFQLDLTFGRIAGKWWGSRDKRPILMIHGWQDNAGTFETLIPLLPQHFSYLAIDMPGHGFSSHLPKGCYYHTVDFVPLLAEIRIQMKWDRLSLIGHSMGAIVSFCYASLFPEHVDLVVALDTLKMQHHHPQYIERIYTWRTQQLIKLIEKLKEQPPDYTHDELIERIYDGSLQSVTKENAKYLMERGTKSSPNHPNRFYFTRDIRVKFMQPFLVEQIIGMEYVKRIKAAYLFIKADDRDFAEPEKNLRQAVQLFKKVNKKFEMLKVRGTHHAHLNEPALMAQQISTFLKKYYNSDEQQSITFGFKSKL